MDEDEFPADGPSAACFRAADGTLVVEVDLRSLDVPCLARIVGLARRVGAGAIWVQGAIVEAGLGFGRRGGYARLEAADPPPPVDLARPPLEAVRALQIDCFSGVWGQAEPASEPDPEAAFVGLFESGSWKGVCGVDLTERLIDAPGVLPGFRTSDRYARLVRGAAALLGPGPVTLESWGDSEETLAAYSALGFVIVDYVEGWELRL